MHVAAQGDQPLILAYLNGAGLDPNSLDLKNSLPLHWAAFMGSELAATLLLTWSPPLHQQDSDGQSPLHMACISGNVKIVRSLLIKGASREIRDLKNKRPAEIAQENKNGSLAKMLAKPGILAECDIKPPLRPPQSSYMSLSVYLLGFVGGGLLHTFYNVPYSNLGISGLFVTMYLISIISFIGISFKDPGYVKSSSMSCLLYTSDAADE